jgi:hypothetical protein
LGFISQKYILSSKNLFINVSENIVKLRDLGSLYLNNIQDKNIDKGIITKISSNIFKEDKSVDTYQKSKSE